MVSIDSTTLSGLVSVANMDPAHMQAWAHGGLELIGALALAPKLIRYGTPWVIRVADRMSSAMLAIPILRNLVLLFADDILACVEQCQQAGDQLVDTFQARLKENIERAEREGAQGPSRAPDRAGQAPPGAGSHTSPPQEGR